MEYKGSKKHILELIESKDFIATINTILLPYQAKIIDKKYIQPKGSMDVSEHGLQTFINTNKLRERFPTLMDFDFNTWWKPSGGKAPTWDMISLCQLDGEDAILLVEAKAHKSEFSRSKKQLPKNKQPDNKPSEGSEINHLNIEARIKEASDNLNAKNTGFNISTTSHYQLSNRVASAWRLNQMGVPVVLLYLGFTGDTYFKKDYFQDNALWRQEFTKYIDSVVPSAFINNIESDFLFIQSSLEVK
ncbi:MAG: hypothetical protein PHF81_03465 [Flavobacterium sp.]|nr:hypothetical protein [Flavobacterium sp.]